MTQVLLPLLPQWSDVELRLGLGEPHPLQIAVDPDVVLVVDPTSRELGLIGPTERRVSEATRPAKGLRVQPQGTRRVGIWVEDEALLQLGWTFLVRVAALIIDGADTMSALEAELGRWRELVARLSPGSAQAYFGLLGELAVLRSAITHGHDLSCWVGAEGGPIDFRFGVLECEVKTTLGNRHEHLINGQEQLRPSVGGRLSLVSLMVAPAEVGSGESVRSLLTELIEAGLKDLSSWHDMLLSRNVDLEDPLALSCYVLRSTPLAVDVGEGFPAITKQALAGLFGAESARIRDVVYRLDLEGMPATTNPDLLTLLEGVNLD